MTCCVLLVTVIELPLRVCYVVRYMSVTLMNQKCSPSIPICPYWVSGCYGPYGGFVVQLVPLLLGHCKLTLHRSARTPEVSPPLPFQLRPPVSATPLPKLAHGSLIVRSWLAHGMGVVCGVVWGGCPGTVYESVLGLVRG